MLLVCYDYKTLSLSIYVTHSHINLQETFITEISEMNINRFSACSLVMLVIGVFTYVL